jgi:putative addiction module component (TIGR02574 family)
MNATLQKELAALSREEKAEVIDFLLPAVVASDDEEISPELMAELERRIAEHEADPSGAITLEEWRKERGLSR